MLIWCAAVCLAATVFPGGCVQTTHVARKEARLQCERDGKVFLERAKISNFGLFGSVTVAGDCLGPGG